MSTSQRDRLLEQMGDPIYRSALVEQHLRRSLPAQIRALREDRGWSQDELGEHCGKTQEWICKLENPNYGRYSIQTLIDVAAGFDVALMVRFASFSEWLDWYTSRTTLGGVPSYDRDFGAGDTVESATFSQTVNTSPTSPVFMMDGRQGTVIRFSKRSPIAA